MRKFLALVMTAALALSMAAPAFADNTSDNKSVTIVAKTIPVTEHVFSIKIDWDSMDFTYEETVKSTWNPEAKQYVLIEATTTGKWSATEAKIVVTNSSDVPVTVTATYDGTGGSLENNSGTIEACAENGTPATHTVKFKLDTEDGALKSLLSKKQATIGTIAVVVEGDTSST